MARKGNLLFNGDFETGTIEGWELRPFGLSCDYTLVASESAKYFGNYGGLLEATKDYAAGYIAYDKFCSFEEHEAYLFTMYCKNVSGNVIYPVLYGCDDKGNLIDSFALGYLEESGKWLKTQAVLRGIGLVTHFKVGVYAYSMSEGAQYYIDEVKLIPLRSIRSHILADGRFFANLGSYTTWHAWIACVGRCRLRSIVQTSNVTGTSPTLDIRLTIPMITDQIIYYTLEHTQFAGEGFEEVSIELPEMSYILVEYEFGGSDTKFTIRHQIRVEPDVSESGTLYS